MHTWQHLWQPRDATAAHRQSFYFSIFWIRSRRRETSRTQGTRDTHIYLRSIIHQALLHTCEVGRMIHKALNHPPLTPVPNLLSLDGSLFTFNPTGDVHPP